MNKVTTKLTVCFERPFWIGVVERIDEGKYQTTRIVFGPEPKDYDVYDFIMKNYFKLRFSNPIQNGDMSQKKINPKRLHRMIKSEVQDVGIGTKAQRALKKQQEVNKMERKKLSKERKEEQQKRKFELKQQKKKEKKKGH
ncbi:YjdF family protein [Lutibacter sp. B2]|nr:YjdF family protein [Lutibacter sp. B2]